MSQSQNQKAPQVQTTKSGTSTNSDLAEILDPTDLLLKVIDSPEEFRNAVSQAQMNNQDFLTVSPRMFKYLIKDEKLNSFTYGQPGIQVFKDGTREDVEREQDMSADYYYKHMSDKKAQSLK